MGLLEGPRKYPTVKKLRPEDFKFNFFDIVCNIPSCSMLRWRSTEGSSLTGGRCQALLCPGVSSPSVREGVQGQALQGAFEEIPDTSNGGGSLLSSPSKKEWSSSLAQRSTLSSWRSWGGGEFETGRRLQGYGVSSRLTAQSPGCMRGVWGPGLLGQPAQQTRRLCFSQFSSTTSSSS